MAQYAMAAYWEERYTRDTEFFDWYQRWAGLKTLLEKYIEHKDRFLIVGCGRSKLSEELYDDGYKQQVNIDVSKTAIDAMTQLYKDRSSMEFRVQDVTDLSDHPTASFDCVLDKGTLDCILCGEESTVQAGKMLQGVSRVLRPEGGRYICITYGQPSFRLPYLERPELKWKVEVLTVPKPTLTTETGAAVAENQPEVHYVYVCTRSVEVADPKVGINQ